MRTILFLLLTIGTFLFYLWERACSFDQCQQIARMQEQRHRMQEVCDSLQACAANARSDYRIACLARQFGLEPKHALVDLAVATAVAQTAEQANKARAGKTVGKNRPLAIAGKNAKARTGKKPVGHNPQLTSLLSGSPKHAGGEM